MRNNSVLLFCRDGMGVAPQELPHHLAAKYLKLTLLSDDLPSKIVFYTEGVRLVCAGSPVIEQLRELESKGVELVICQTCLEFFHLGDQVQVGVVGGMGDILEALQKAEKIIPI